MPLGSRWRSGASRALRRPQAVTVVQAPVDVALVLAVDSSGSVSEERMRMQIRGYLDAMHHPGFIAAVQGGAYGRIATTFVEWSDAGRQNLAVDWMLIENEAHVAEFARTLQQAPHPNPGWTSISGAIDYSVHHFERGGFRSGRRVIDISGDGTNNDGRPVADARDDAVSAGITINGLPIIEVEPELERYYRDNVVGGPDSFVIVAQSIESFAQAVLRKLLLEVAGLPPPDHA